MTQTITIAVESKNEALILIKAGAILSALQEIRKVVGREVRGKTFFTTGKSTEEALEWVQQIINEEIDIQELHEVMCL